MRLFRILPFAWVAVAIGCTAAPVAPGPSGKSIVNNDPYTSDGGSVEGAGGAAGPPEASVDAGAALAAGSPLCLSTTTSCDPDDSATCVLPDEGGTPTCHVLPSNSAETSGGMGVATACSAAGHGEDGAACMAQSDCAPDYDCVGTSTPGACRHYCCAGEGVCDSDQFCDVQPLASATTTKVPVCMPIEPAGGCDLLGGGDAGEDHSCPAGKTCAVVREDGTTGCVAIGNQGPGQACDVDHCQAGLVCLGTPGEQTCYALCHTSSPSDCTAPMTCQGGLPLFQDPAFGVCR